uniref:Uncharacterized protein n=1 Tax=Acanthochromis polyacanthus TaxID=80966 RepID=A0A3Q1HBU6_9TELE
GDAWPEKQHIPTAVKKEALPLEISWSADHLDKETRTKNTKPTIKHGGVLRSSLGHFSLGGTGQRQLCEGRMNQVMYRIRSCSS